MRRISFSIPNGVAEVEQPNEGQIDMFNLDGVTASVSSAEGVSPLLPADEFLFDPGGNEHIQVLEPGTTITFYGETLEGPGFTLQLGRRL